MTDYMLICRNIVCTEPGCVSVGMLEHTMCSGELVRPGVWTNHTTLIERKLDGKVYSEGNISVYA